MITDYASLQSEVIDWLNRPDLAAKVPVFIQLAEAEIAADVRRKTIRNTVTFTQAAFPLPADCGELRSLHLVTGITGWDGPIDICTPEMLADFRTVLAASGRPVKAGVVGTDLLLVPAPDQAYQAELTYYEKLVSLSTTSTTNSILLEAPNIYLWGALLQAEPYLKNDSRIATWQSKYDTGVAKLDAKREREETAASLRPMRLPVVFGG